MRIVIQRVKKALVEIENQIYSSINNGLLIFVGFEESDQKEDIEWLSAKIINLRIFNDENNIMNLAINEINGEILVVSQFTLHAKTKKGNRPSYINAAKPDIAIPLYNDFIHQLELLLNKKVATGIFGADMQVSLVNDGPVTILIDSKQRE